MTQKKLTALTGSGQTHPEASIQVKQLPAVEFHGQRVVTFAMIDEAHRRPRDTAKKAFQRNRARFIDGDDFFIVGASEVEWDITDHLARALNALAKK